MLEGSKWAERWSVMEEPKRDVGQWMGGGEGQGRIRIMA